MKTNSIFPSTVVACFGLLLSISISNAQRNPRGGIQSEPKSLETPTTTGSIDRLDDRINLLIPEDAEIEVLVEGIQWAEGPVYVPSGDYVLFSDVVRNTIFKWKEGEPLGTYLNPSGYTGEEPFTGREPGSNGLILDQNGLLVLCRHGDRQIVRQESNGEFTVLASDYDGKRFNSPNDLVMKRTTPSDRAIYFTDPAFGLPRGATRETEFMGVYRRATNGRVTLLTDKIESPNGIGFSPDETKLYVASTSGRTPYWYVFNVLEDGRIDEGEVFADASKLETRGPGGPDGFAVDASGNLWASGPGGILVFNPEGEHLGTILTERRTANCTFGGPDGSTLYITANTTLLRIKTNAKGIGME